MSSLISLLDDDSMGLDETTIHNIIMLASTDIVKNNLLTVTLDPVDANRYKGNLFGLLKNVVEIPNSAIYINMVINGYTSSLDYDGKLQLSIVNSDIAQNIITFLQEEKTLKTSMGI